MPSGSKFSTLRNTLKRKARLTEDEHKKKEEKKDHDEKKDDEEKSDEKKPEEKFFSAVPETPNEWEDAANQAGVSSEALAEYANMRSGSKFGQKQYLLFRTLFHSMEVQQFDPKKIGIELQLRNARELLNKSTAFNSYIEAIENKTEGGLGSFVNLRRYQQTGILMHNPPSKPSKDKGLKGPKGMDETPVNFTLLLLLNAIAKPPQAPVWNGSLSRLVWWRNSRLQRKATAKRSTRPRGNSSPSQMANCKTRRHINSRQSLSVRPMYVTLKFRRSACRRQESSWRGLSNGQVKQNSEFPYLGKGLEAHT
jgi:hypothetical protein